MNEQPSWTTAGGRERLPAFRRFALSLTTGRIIELVAAGVLIAGGLIALWSLRQGGGGDRLPQSLVLGALFGIVLQRSRFCFLCHVRDFLTRGEASGVAAILLSIAVGTLGYAVVFGAWLPDAFAGRLPPDAHIGPVGPALLIASFAFGLGMAISGSCISGHLYRLGEGSPTAPFALVGTILGFVLGFQTWNAIYVTSIAGAPVSWLPASTGYPVWIALQLGLLALIAGVVAWRGTRVPRAEQSQHDGPLPHALNRIFIQRWPYTVGGAAVGVLATLAYFQVQPLGVTAAIGSLARHAASSVGLLPETLHGLDGYAGCRTTIATWLSTNAVFVLALVGASLAAALIAGQFKPARPTGRQVANGLVGGVLLGWAAMTAIGCTVGTLLSGTMAGAVSGWIFFFGCFVGVGTGIKVIELCERRLKSQE